jgi:hypothetical protein
MKIQSAAVALLLFALISCGPSGDGAYPDPPSASEVARNLPPLEMPVPASPVGLRTAVLTLPEDALAGMSLDGRRNYLARKSPTLDEVNRRIQYSSDNPYTGIDADSMFYLRLFEDEKGRTIAASHRAQPFADGTPPSARFTRVYRLEEGKWRDITDSALAPGIPRDAYFRFDEPGSKVPFGPYVEESRADGRGKSQTFGKAERVMRWRNGAFRED